MAHKLLSTIRTSCSTLPIGVQLDLTNKCTGNCSYCKHKTWPDAELSYEVCKAVLLDAQRAGFLSATLSGGSPQLHPDFWGIIDYAKRIGLAVNVFTDGVHWTWPGMHVQMPDRIHFSVDTMDDDRHKKIRGVNTLWMTVDAIEDAIARYVPVRLMSTVVPGYIEEAFSVLDWVGRKFDAGAYIDHRMYLVHDFGEFGDEDRAETQRQVRLALERYGNPSWNNAVDFLGAMYRQGQVYRPTQCVIPFVHRVVAADGLIFGCCFADHDNDNWDDVWQLRREFALGDATADHGFEDAWKSPPIKVLNEYRNVQLGTACAACSSVNSRYAEVNKAWGLQSSDAPVYI